MPTITISRKRQFILSVLTIMLLSSGGFARDHELITMSDLEGLPQPVQKFLTYSGIVGTPWITEVSLEQEGLFKTAPDRDWVPFTATQVFNIEEASFEWKVRMKMAPMMLVTGRDALQDGQGTMKIKLFGIFPIVNASGAEIDQGSMTRYLSESIWFPQAFLDDHISWESIDSLSAKATLTINDKSVDGVFHFNDLGQVTYFECNRYYSEGDNAVLKPWFTPVDEYRQFDGLSIGSRGRALWKLADGDFTYVDVRITKLFYR